MLCTSMTKDHQRQVDKLVRLTGDSDIEVVWIYTWAMYSAVFTLLSIAKSYIIVPKYRRIRKLLLLLIFSR